MSKFMKLEVKDKEYLIGFSNRASVLKAERKGFMKILNEFDNAPVEGTAKLLQIGLLEKQPEITLPECNQILEEYIAEHTSDTEEADVGQISSFIISQYNVFLFVSTGNGKKEITKLPIVEV